MPVRPIPHVPPFDDVLSIVNPSSTNSATWPGSPVTPTLLALTKTYIGPGDETASGPNYPRDYCIDVDIAPGQTIANLDVTDLLPNNVAFLSVVSSSPAGASVIATPPIGAAANPPNNRLTLRFPSVTGGAAANDASVTLRFFVPLSDANDNPVINAAYGNDAQSLNNARAQGNWTPLDARDPSSPGNALVDGVGPEHTLTDKSIAIQKVSRSSAMSARPATRSATRWSTCSSSRSPTISPSRTWWSSSMHCWTTASSAATTPATRARTHSLCS